MITMKSEEQIIFEDGHIISQMKVMMKTAKN